MGDRVRAELTDAQRDLKAYGDTYIGWSKGVSAGKVADTEAWLGWELPEDTEWFFHRYKGEVQVDDEPERYDYAALVIQTSGPYGPNWETKYPGFDERYGITAAFEAITEYECRPQSPDAGGAQEPPGKNRLRVAHSEAGYFYQYENGTIAYERNDVRQPDVVATSFTEFLRRQVLIKEPLQP